MDENGDSFNSTKSTHTSFLNVCKSENEKDFDEFDNLSPILDAVENAVYAGDLSVPFDTVFHPGGAYSSSKHSFWIPNIDINVVIEGYKKEEFQHILNPYLYKVKVTHGDHVWWVYRRYKHFRQLHDALVLFKAMSRFPMRQNEKRNERRKSMVEEWRRQPVVSFPIRPEALVRQDEIEHRVKQLENYLQSLLQCKSYRNHPETFSFFEVSHLSFVSCIGLKAKEGMIKKCSGGRHISLWCCGCLQKFHLMGRWKERWLVLKDTCLAYVRPEDGLISDVILMDSQFRVDCGMKATGAKHGVLISNLNRNLLIKCWTSRKAQEWAEHILMVRENHAADFTGLNRFRSFAPPRPDSYAQWIVDASSYFESVADALENAKEEIYITDWWLSPEVYMKRPAVDGDHWRLDIILRRKAVSGDGSMEQHCYYRQPAQGVRVFVLLYKEIEAALMINSVYSKQVLMSSENIKVLRHPDHIPGKGVLLWSHHEKMVAIDQQVAFLGGIDLCYGRWDDFKHRLTDLGSIALNSPPDADDIGRREVSVDTDVSELTEDIQDEDQVKCHQATPEVVPSAGVGEVSSTLTEQVGLFSDKRVSPTSEGSYENFGGGDCGSARAGSFSNRPEGSSILPEDVMEVGHMQDKLTADTKVSHHMLMLTKGSDTGKCCLSFHNSDEHCGDCPNNAMDVGSTDEACSLARHPGILEQPRPASEVLDLKTSRAEIDPASDGRCLQQPWTSPREPVGMREGAAMREHHLWNANVSRNLSEQKISSIVSLVSHDRLTGPAFIAANSGDNWSFQDASNVSTISKSSNCGLIYPRDIQQNTNSNFPFTSPDTKSVREDNQRAGKVLGIWGTKWARNMDVAPNSSADVHAMPSEASDDLAQRRWRLVLNVKKFESTVRQSAGIDRISSDLLEKFTGYKDTSEARRKQSRTLLRKVGDLFKTDHSNNFTLRRSVDSQNNSLTDVDRIGVYRTKSEQGIVECGLHGGSTRLWIGKDYVNFIHKDFVDLHKPAEDFINRFTTPRMPWHDVGAVVYGKSARDLARHFICRWNFAKLAKCKKNDFYPLLLPKSYSTLTVPQYVRRNMYSVETQIIRSLSGWSGGISTVEKSIQDAYEFCIENAKNYIYIENQFFITQIDDTSTVSNCIGTALFRRILRAHRNNEDFKVYVMMPLLPAFEGEFGNSTTGVALHAITHWNYSSICRGGSSIMEKLASSEVGDPQKYIVFCGLRTWDKLHDRLVTELIYIHSKLMIVDDNTVILGSANINDRSMLGKRDSELAIVVRDKNREKVFKNNHILQPGHFASGLRRYLFHEHMGLAGHEMDISDISTDEFFHDVWRNRAARNTDVFERVFRCLPTDQVCSFLQLNDYNSISNMASTDPEQALKELRDIQGRVVLIPLRFLCDESLAPKVGQVEAFLPSSIWT